MEPHGVVRMGNLKRFIWPSRYLAVHMMESVARRGVRVAPRGTTSAYPRMTMAPVGHAFTQEKHSQQRSGSWLKAIPCSLLNTFPRSASHLSGFTYVGIFVPPP